MPTILREMIQSKDNNSKYWPQSSQPRAAGDSNHSNDSPESQSTPPVPINYSYSWHSLPQRMDVAPTAWTERGLSQRLRSVPITASDRWFVFVALGLFVVFLFVAWCVWSLRGSIQERLQVLRYQKRTQNWPLVPAGLGSTIFPFCSVDERVSVFPKLQSRRFEARRGLAETTPRTQNNWHKDKARLTEIKIQKIMTSHY